MIRPDLEPLPFAQIWVDDSNVSAEVLGWFESEGLYYQIMSDVNLAESGPYAPHPPAAQIVYGEEAGALHNGPQDISNVVLNSLIRHRDELIEKLKTDLAIRDLEDDV